MLSTKVLASSPLAKFLTDDMTDELMHELSTMTEIALLWNPCSDLFLIDRACDKAICFTTRLHPKTNPKPTLLAPTTDIIALLSGNSTPRAHLRQAHTPEKHHSQATRARGMPVMGWKSSAVAKATIYPCKICQHGVTMPPKLSTGGRADPPTEPRPAHNTWPIQNVSVAAWRARNTAAVVVRTTMSRVSCQSSRECCRNFGNVPATSGTFAKFPQGRSAIFRWTPSIRRGFAKSTLVGIYASLLFLPP